MAPQEDGRISPHRHRFPLTPRGGDFRILTVRQVMMVLRARYSQARLATAGLFYACPVRARPVLPELETGFPFGSVWKRFRPLGNHVLRGYSQNTGGHLPCLFAAPPSYDPFSCLKTASIAYGRPKRHRALKRREPRCRKPTGPIRFRQDATGTRVASSRRCGALFQLHALRGHVRPRGPDSPKRCS